MSALAPHGLRGVDHVGLTVLDLDAAIDFLTETLGGTLALRHGPYPASTSNPRQFARPAESSVRGIAVVSVGPTNIELLEFDSPTASTTSPRPDETGACHLAFYVDDLAGAVEAARASGVEILGDPMELPGPEAGEGARFIFLRAPWGGLVELVTYPNGKRYMATEPHLLEDLRTHDRLG